MLNIHPQTVNIIFFHFLLVVILFTSLRLANGDYRPTNHTTGAFMFLLVILLLMGLRPYNVPGVGTYFGDTANYYRIFKELALGYRIVSYEDLAFALLTNFFAKYIDAASYFFALSALYLFPIWLAIKRFSPSNTLLLLLMFVSSGMFWSNGINGLRIGIATSWFFLAVTYPYNRWLQFIIFVLSITFHKSMMLPVIAYFLSLFYENSKVYIYWWFISIGLSLLMGGFWENFFARFNVGDERFTEYLTGINDKSLFSHIGFRWDFLAYSTIPVALGAHYIFIKHYADKLYIQLFNIYLVANSFWILVMRAHFSNRFASLSWFLIPVILLLPLLKATMWKKQNEKIAFILLLSYAFTYYQVSYLIWG